jgi:hypothetical protein
VVARRYYYGTDGVATFFSQFSSDEQAKNLGLAAPLTSQSSITFGRMPRRITHKALPDGEQKALPPYYASRVVINSPSPPRLETWLRLHCTEIERHVVQEECRRIYCDRLHAQHGHRLTRALINICATVHVGHRSHP